MWIVQRSDDSIVCEFRSQVAAELYSVWLNRQGEDTFVVKDEGGR